jgi:hypothetical protein
MTLLSGFGSDLRVLAAQIRKGADRRCLFDLNTLLGRGSLVRVRSPVNEPRLPGARGPSRARSDENSRRLGPSTSPFTTNSRKSCGVGHGGERVLPERLLVRCPRRRETERGVDDGIGMEQVIEGVKIARITSGQPAEDNGVTRIGHATSARRGSATTKTTTMMATDNTARTTLPRVRRECDAVTRPAEARPRRTRWQWP